MRLIDADKIVNSSMLHTMKKEELLSAIIEAPAINTAPVVHARWINEGYSKMCTNCNGIIGFADPYYNYCPHCGAKIDFD